MTATPHAPRLDYRAYCALAPDVIAAIGQLSGLAEKHGFDRRLVELLKLRASQINGCAFCVSYHLIEAQKLGVPAAKLHMVTAWRETPLFDARERAALEWTEALTLIGQGVPDEAYEAARAVFSGAELAHLTAAVLAINAWNRLAIAYRFAPLPIPAGQPVHSAAQVA